MMEVTSHTKDDVSILFLNGKLSMGHGDVDLHKAIQDLLLDHKLKIVLNMRKLAYVDSTGIGVLVSKFTSTAQRDGRLVICEPNDKVMGLLQMTQLDKVINIYASEEEALASFN
jgi:anti-sigma B factor antagonist